jgi:hypothetical protein
MSKTFLEKIHKHCSKLVRGRTTIGVPNLHIQSFIPQSALRQFHCLFQSQFSPACDLVLPLAIYSNLSFYLGQTLAAYVFFLVYLSLQFFRISLSNVF